VDHEKGDGSGRATAQDVSTAKAAFCAFSLGTRGCIGKSVAHMELMLAAAKVLWLFDLRKPGDLDSAGKQPAGLDLPGPTGEGDPAALQEGRRRVGEDQLEDGFTSRRQGPMVQFRRRGGGGRVVVGDKSAAGGSGGSEAGWQSEKEGRCCGSSGM